VIEIKPTVAIQLTQIEPLGTNLFFWLSAQASVKESSVFTIKTSLCISGILMNGVFQPK